MLIRSLILATVAMTGLNAASVTIDVAQTRQTIEGFGTCLVSWGKYPPIYQDERMAKIYAETMGFTFLRTNMAAWGYPQTDHAQDITADKIDLSDRNNSRLSVFIEFAKKVQDLQPELKVIGSVWSPVAWMKLNNQITAGKGDKKERGIHSTSYKQGGNGPEARNRVDPKYFPHFCQWMIAQMQQFKDHGVPFYAVSPGNEVMFSQSFESCVWTAEDFATIVAMLGKAKAAAGFADTKIFGPETMTQHNFAHGNPPYLKALRQNAEAWKYFDIYATHGYVDGFKEDLGADSAYEFWNAIKDDNKPYWVTEGGTGEHAWPAPLTGVAAGAHNNLVFGNVSAFVPWQITESKASQHALMTDFTPTKKTHAMRHFSVFIRPGAQRIHVGGEAGTLQVSAYLHRELGQLVVVAINAQTEAQDLNIDLAGLKVSSFVQHRTSATEDVAAVAPVAVSGNAARVSLPAESMITLVATGVR